MKIFILENDEDTADLITKIIQEREIGEYIIGNSDIEKAMEEINAIEPDIVVSGLVYEKKNGLKLIKEIKEENPSIHFIVISQIVSKEVIGMAYKSGAEYYITKPVDILEIESVLERVKEKILMKKKLMQIMELLTIRDDGEGPGKRFENNTRKINKTMQKLGILGETGSKDIISVVSYLMLQGATMGDYTVSEICQLFSDNPKTMEQRIRRAAAIGMINIANLGIEDYMNETFIEYSNGLYNFEQIKQEMDYIRKKSKKRGAVNIKKFIDNMLYYAKE